MEKNRKSKFLTLAVLLVGVVGLSIGFASFSSNLDIKSSADVKPVDTFKIVFSSSNTEQLEDAIVGVVTPSDEDIDVEDAIINNNGTNPTIGNLKATFNRPGQSAKYSFYAHNNGEYEAFLNAITFKPVENETATKVCTAATGTSTDLVEAACEGISISVTVGGKTYTASNDDINSVSLGIDKYAPIDVIISYASDSKIADGDFEVSFGDITLNYGSQD